MQNKPIISVIVPVYNAENYLDRCMNAIYAQTFKDYEIILVNDGSTDRSDDICREYAAKDARITYIKKNNEGAGSARNLGIERANGEYIAFPDVDDWFDPEMYETLYHVAKEKDYDVVFSGVKYYRKGENDELIFDREANLTRVSYLTQDECRKNIMRFFPTTTIFDVPWNKLYKRSVMIENHVRFSDTRRCQDAMFNLDFFDSIHSAASVDQGYYHYIENTPADVQRKFPKNYIDITMSYYQKLITMLSSWNIYEGDVKEHYDTSFVISVYESLMMFDNPKWALTKKEKKSYIRSNLSRKDLEEFLKNACVRPEEQEKYRILKEKNYTRFMRNYRIEKLKDRVRHTSVIKIYRAMKKS